MARSIHPEMALDALASGPASTVAVAAKAVPDRVGNVAAWRPSTDRVVPQLQVVYARCRIPGTGRCCLGHLQGRLAFRRQVAYTFPTSSLLRGLRVRRWLIEP